MEFWIVINMNDKEKKKFDVALINSNVVYWYMKNMDGSFDKYLDRINNYLEWLAKRPSQKTPILFTIIAHPGHPL